MSTIRANNFQGLDAANPAIELPADGTLIVASGFSGDLESKGAFVASGLTVESTATFAVGASGTPAIAASGDLNTGIYFPAADTIGFTEGGNEAVRISSAGRVGIGTTSPSTNLHVQVASDEAIRASATGANQGVYSRYIAGSPSDVDLHVGTDGASGGTFGVGGGAVVWNAGNGPLAFGTNDTERMRILDNGHMGFGCTARLGQGGIFFRQNTSNGAAEFTWNRADTALDSFVMLFHNNTNTVGSISHDNVSTSYNTSSDYRLKENIVDLDGAIDRVKQLLPRRFNFLASPEKTVDGFIAHEAQAVVPEAVKGTHNELQVWQEDEELPDGVSVGDNKLDEDGNTIPKYQGIDQSKLVPLLTAALKETIGRIETLEAEVAALKAS